MIHPLVLYCHGHPGYDKIIHHHIEQRRGEDSAIRCTPCIGNGRSVEAVLSWNHLLTFPEALQEPTEPRARSIPLQCDKEVVLVHGVIGIPEFQEYQEEGVLVYSSEILGEL